MKKTFQVNLGNRVYSIDEDAYLRLKEYLDRIEGYFSDQHEREDILNDIEGRIAELFTERLNQGRQVINLSDVTEVTGIMGDPREISGTGEPPRPEMPRYSGSRRIYRDPDDRVFGGVCSGLAWYFGLDRVMVRLLFVLFMIFGIGLLVYIILWIVTPEALTTAQKLEMRGDPVNASNIGNFFSEEFESVKKHFRRNKKNNK
jgi:phage shock protein PspC (stress-responsive transcriptional regulator)